MVPNGCLLYNSEEPRLAAGVMDPGASQHGSFVHRRHKPTGIVVERTTRVEPGPEDEALSLIREYSDAYLAG